MKPVEEASETGFVPRGRRSEDADGWRELVRRFAPYVHAVCGAHELREDEGERVFEEVFTRMWTEIDRLEDDEALRARVTELTEDVARESARAPVSAETLRMLSQALTVHGPSAACPRRSAELR